MKGNPSLYVPTYSVNVELLLCDGSTVQGMLFLPIISDSHMSLLKFLNSHEQFLPFCEKDIPNTQLINKDLVVCTTCERDLPALERNLDQTSPHEQISVEIMNNKQNLILTGNVTLVSKENARVLDFLNQPGQFFSIIKGETEINVNKRYVIRVKEALD
ncbi:MAG: hypothetical protein RMM17_07270 [Acidobacteriota bacterium]|nr:hypothetical protein [Blastocatellia bacterium]MDW8412465.1 hypothetical protein [Acidobacteriota bacterium]